MDPMLLTFVILLITIGLFISGRYRADSVAMFALLALLLCGLVNTREALSGFAAAPVIMIASLFLVGGGLTDRRHPLAGPAPGGHGRQQ